MKIDVQELQKKLINIIATTTGKASEDIKPTCNLKDDVGVDELDSVEIIMSIEEDYSIQIPDEEAEKFVTVEDLVNFVVKQLDPEADKPAEGGNKPAGEGNEPAPKAKTDEEILATPEDKLTDEEAKRKVAILEKKAEDELMAKPEDQLTEEEKAKKAVILEKRKPAEGKE